MTLANSIRCAILAACACGSVVTANAISYETEEWEIPAARIEEHSNTYENLPWQLENLYEEYPIEDLLAGIPYPYGGYALPVAPPDQELPDPDSYEAVWLEYLRQNMETYGLITPAEQPEAEELTVVELVMPATHPMLFLAEDSPIQESFATAPAEVPEVNSLFAVLIGGAIYGVVTRRRRKKEVRASSRCQSSAP